ncbi:MAG TPA: ABC transporter ATP-binding protein [Candidatus Limnocylindria bacterium]|nr:ABC transporter ATP-binding protein [Candidatus Limnocylindria bacterium]
MDWRHDGRCDVTLPTARVGVGAGRQGSRIEVRRLDKTYRLQTSQEVPALTDISFHVDAGEFVSIVGPSGCGKSTLLRIIGGISHATGGEVQVDGSPVRGPRRDVGFVFQDPTLLPWRDVLQNAMIGIEILGLDRTEYRARARELINLVGLVGFERAHPGELSGGMQQRAAIVRALLHDPKLLLLDEPFGALDAMTREAMGLELLRIWAANQTSVVFVTHSVLEALFLADRVIVFSARPGRVLDIVTVGLPRPRRLEMMVSPEIGALATHIRNLIGVQAEAVA